ncbi:MAG: transglutaminase N-terminal domain-containing protein [Bryobacteraceae bacterium]
MTYKIVHRTTYKYKSSVSFGDHVACLTPRNLPHHRCIRNEIQVTPEAHCRKRRDYFGNQLCFFTVDEPHRQLVVEARSEVKIVEHPTACLKASPAWEQVAQSIPGLRTQDGLDAYQFVFESPRIRPSQEFAAYACISFIPGRPFAEALLDLTARINKDFKFDAKATSVRTPPEEILRTRRGVCQDFAHLQIACLRSLRVPARYVSGYLRTFPLPGRPRLVGSDVSHAWVSAYSEQTGWIDVDPTNNVVPSYNHVILGWGRDYGDVSPLRGLILGGRDHSLKVSVDVEPIEG